VKSADQSSVTIAGRGVGEGHPCFIIAEAGSNHNGRLRTALRLIDVAAEAGADAVKFQTFRADTLYPKRSAPVAYLRRLGVTEPIHEIVRRMEMPLAWIPKLAAHCRRRRILFLSTPFDERCADLLEPHVPAFKVASYELTHLPLLRHLAGKGKPMIVSTGAGSMEEVRRAVRAVRAAGNPGLCLMQCTARYPSPPETLNLRTIPAMRRRFGVPVGLSDHSTDPVVGPVAAVALGASLLEKHYTLSRGLPGPDHSFAVEPAELAELVRAVRAAEAALGSGRKELQPAERELADYRRSIYTRRPVARGERFSTDALIVLRRPGRPDPGLAPADWERVLRRRAARALPEGHLLAPGDLA
jgi:sialic acid synthase SpsE